MGVPSPRTPVRIARGTKSVLETNKGALEEGEICYATDENSCYVKEGSNLESITKDVLDEDNFSSNSATQPASQQSIKAYVDGVDATKAPLAQPNFTDHIGLHGTNKNVFVTAGQENGFRIVVDASDVSSTTTLFSMGYSSSADQCSLNSPTKTIVISGGGDTSAIFTPSAAVTLKYNDNSKFATTNTGVEITGNIVGSANVSVPDWTGSANAYLAGAGNDLQLYHDGTNSYVVNTTGELRLDPKTSERGIVLTADGSVDLYYDNVKKLETTATGVKVTGDSVGNMTTVNYGASTALVLTSSAYHKITLTGNIAFTCASEAEGQSGSIFITQDGTGSRTASWSSDFKWPGGTAPTLSTAANAVDRIDYVVLAAANIHCVATLDVK